MEVKIKQSKSKEILEKYGYGGKTVKVKTPKEEDYKPRGKVVYGDNALTLE